MFPTTSMRALNFCVATATVFWAAGCKPTPESSSPAAGPPTTAPDAKVSSTARPAIAGRPGLNILFISVDTTRPDYLACYGHPKAQTPNIDRLASEGTRFATCISSMPLTLGSHCTMLTGSYPYVHGVRENGIFELCDNNQTLAEIFRDHGYATTAEVATIILDKKYGMNQGFDHYGDVPPSASKEADVMVFGNMEGKARATTQPAPMVDEAPDVERSAETVSGAVIKTLEKHAGGTKPFFLFAHFYDPHWPFTAPEPYRSRFPDDPYSAEIAYFDANLGTILEALTRLGLKDKTLVVLTSDHGESKGQHGEFTHGTFLYDATLRVPLIMRCPGLIPAGLVVEAQVRLLDLAQTILELTGLFAARTEQMQGTSLAPMLADPRLDLQLACYSDTIVPKTTYGFSPLRSLRTQDWKYVLSPVPELYDLKGDGLELFNLSGAQSDRSMEMRQALWDTIRESPPPRCERAMVKGVDKKSLSALRALGYLGSADTLDDYTTGSELDHFEPKGENPREHVEEIELMCGALGALRFGYYEEAEKLLKKLHELLPDHTMVASSLGTALSALKKYEEAETVLRRSVELTPEDAAEWARLGGVQAMLKKYGEAEKTLRKAISMDDKSAVAWTNLGVVLTFQNRHEEALKALDEADRIHPGLSPIHALKGEAHEGLQQFDAALIAYRKAMAIDPTVVRAQRGVGSILMQSGKWDEAIAHLSKAVELLPTSAVLRVQLGECFAQKGQLEEANQAFERAIEIDPELAQAHLLFGINLRKLKRESEAVAVLRDAVRYNPDFAPAQAQLAGALDKSGQPKEALAEYEKLVSRWPKFGPGYRSAARVALELKQTAKAIEILDKGAKQFEDDPNIVNDLAWLLATSSDSRLRDGRRALALAERNSMLADHHDANRLDTLAAAYAEIGDFEKARSTLDRAMEIAGPDGDKSLVEELKMRRDLYARAQPYRSQ